MVALSSSRSVAAMACSRGALVTARDEKTGIRPCLAAQQGNVELVKALLARKADPNARTNKSAPIPAKVSVR
jgi:hypothetical protein